MIHFQNVRYTYPQAERPALDGIALHIPEGDFALVVGASGAGKSTLLRCVNGLVPHFSGGTLQGDLAVNGLNPVQAAPQVMSHHVGFVFQDPEAQFVMNRVEDEIAFALENAALPSQEMRVRVEEALDLLDLAPMRGRRLETLSGGERQRVAIASALALRPRVLVLDEPTSQLDPKSAEDVLHALVRLNTDLGLTILLAEHRLERVLPFVDTLVYLSADGTAVRVGHPQDILADIDLTPPLVTLGKALGWRPLPLTIKEGKRFSRRYRPAAPRDPFAAPASPHPAAQPYLQVRNVQVGYDRNPVLQDINLEVWPGEIVALMGRNGAGKTTLLKSMVGLLRPDKGRVLVNGQDISRRNVAEVCREVGYLPQDPNTLLFADTVLDELHITLRNHGITPPTNGDAGDAPIHPNILLDELGLSHKAHRYPRDLSAGERQRVALGAVTITKPGALLLDEPTRGLDYAAKDRLIDLLARWRDAGMAILLVTHDVELAAAVADRVLLTSQGEIIAAGKPAAVLGASPLFAPQVARLFPNTGWLTARDALAHIHRAGGSV